MTCWPCQLAWMCLVASLSPPTVKADSCKPSFGYQTFLTIPEDTKVGSELLTVDTGSDAVLSMATQDERFGLIQTNQTDQTHQTNQLFLNSTLDSDASDVSPTISLTCKLPNQPTVTIQVTISVKDVNDNPPIFTQCCYNLSVGEMQRVNTTLSTNVKATDRDKDYNNNAIYYSIVNSSYFAFTDRTRSTELRLLRPLDFESVPVMTVTILAVNELSDIHLNSTAELTITVLDEDDLNPVFNRSVYLGQVLENSPAGTKVTISPPIFAYDGDKTINAPVAYSFHDGQDSGNVFQINGTTAEVSVVTPVAATTVSLVVQATQVDNPTRYGVAMLVVTVQGASVSAPQFLQPAFWAQVPEDSPVGAQILVVAAIDKDFGAQIRYNIVDNTGPFQIASDSGAVTLSAPLDYESTSLYFFTVSASDGLLSSQATVNISVIDVNDNSPTILPQDLSFQVGRERGTLVTTIQAQDNDTNSTLSFSLQNYKSLFSINAFGVLQVAADSRDLTETHYSLVVEVTDDGHPPRASFVVIMVEFSPLSTTVGSVALAAAGPDFNNVAIVLVVIAAVFLLVIVVLVVVICRRRHRNTEHLDVPRVSRSPDPKGLKFKKARRFQIPDLQRQLEEKLEGATPIQADPLETGGALNLGFVQGDDAERDRDMGEIQIETAVVPYDTNPSDDTYPPEDSSDYDDTLQPKQSLRNGLYANIASFSSDNSHSSDDYDHHQGLDVSLANGNIWRSDNSDYAISVESLDPQVSVEPREEKQELTVYF